MTKHLQKVIAGSPLTPREAQVLKLIADAKTNKEIALLLEISVETVKEHVQKILRKLGVPGRIHAGFRYLEDTDQLRRKRVK